MISASAEWANRSGGVAIIGMAGRFPGADDVEAFWRNLRAGVESIRFFSEAELRAAGVSPRLYTDPSYLPASGFLPGIEQFDAAFFGFTPREAQITDPQHRLFLESCWTALESAGYDPKRFPGLIGVYAGCGKSEYLWRHVYPHFAAQGDDDDFQLLVASDKDFLSTRVSYKLGLHGPSLTVQTACSTALVAVCMAWQSLLTFQCDLALAGGVSVDLQGRYGHLHREGMIMSPDGHCRAFDEKAQGTVGGDGVGVIVLKRLEDALAKGDQIYAVIKGAALNNDGSSKVGYTAPSIAGQTQVIAQALAVADIAPSTVSYIEAHGTGTPLGDPIEIAALSEVFAGVPRGSCAIGSVKTNIGHLNSAAGVAGLIKTVQALRYRELPPSLHFTAANPKLNLASSPFFVNTRLRPWTASPRRAGVSSFGIGGTNAHVVLEAAPPPAPLGPTRPFQLLTLSAKTATALAAATANLAAALAASPPLALADVAYTLHVGRQPFSHRAFAVCRDTAQACQVLRATGAEKLQARCTQTEGEVVFLFPGGGSQYPNMGRELYEKESLYREEVDRCALLLLPILGFDIRAELYPRAAEPRAAGERLQRIDLALITLFITEYALAQLWQSFGVTPKALIGHSLGEYTAACLAGVFSLEDALRLVASRGRLMARLPPGAMLGVQLPADELRADLGEELSLAAINGPDSCVLSGSVAAIARVEEVLRQRGVSCHRLHIAVGAHSALVQPILAEFTREVAALRLRPPRLPFISNVSGTWIRPEEATSAEYWARHLRQTVRFGDGLAVLLADAPRSFLEVGPGHTLRGLVSQHPARLPEHTLLSSLRHPQAQLSDVAFLLETVGKLWLTGGTIDWEGFHRGEKPRRVALPTYPFERQEFWIAAPAQPAASVTAGAGLGAPGPALPRDIFYRPAWRLSAAAPEVFGAARWLIFSEGASALGAVGGGWGDSVARLLTARGHQVVLLEPGDRFARRAADRYTVKAADRADYESLLRELDERQLYPQHILHLWNLIPQSAPETEEPQLEAELALSFYGPLALAQALASRPPGGEPLKLTIATCGLQRVADEPTRRPSQAVALGPCRVLPREYDFLRCRLVDLECSAEAAAAQPTPPAIMLPSEQAIRQLVAECSSDQTDCVVAYRQGERWVQTFEPTTLPAPAAAGARLRPRGVYLITGGLGGIGLELASYLAQAVSARLILIGRSTPGPAAQQRVKALEALGAEVFCGVADVADAAALRAVL
ncbi:MAG TPA: beta-ketoacyl synthase N-terminal-like domain-containing protein, partial [Pseudomonadota bacterium]|nr:beta-ketoacyl synthase N-terminal-like domain-containing protein [Pseudomonadota bacterium]